MLFQLGRSRDRKNGDLCRREGQREREREREVVSLEWSAARRLETRHNKTKGDAIKIVVTLTEQRSVPRQGARMTGNKASQAFVDARPQQEREERRKWRGREAKVSHHGQRDVGGGLNKV